MSTNHWKYAMLMKVKILRLFISAIITAAGLTVSGCSVEWKASQIPETGEVAVDFRLEDLDGNTVTLNEFNGSPVLLNFWASWCTPCREEIPLLETIYNDSKWRETGLVILAINVGESKTTVEDFVEEYGISFTVLLDTERNVFRQYFVRGVPTTYFIDTKGVIQRVTIGAFADVEEIEKNLDKIISRS